MASKKPPASTIVLILFLLITFPFWIGIIAAIGGIMAGVFGAVLGIIGGVFGAIAGIISWPFKMFFGWHHWGWWPHVHINGFAVAAIVILAVLISSRNKK